MSAARVCFTGHTNLTNGEQANGIPDHVGRTFSPLGLWGILVLDLGNGGFAKSDQHSLGKMNTFFRHFSSLGPTSCRAQNRDDQ
jgi:hypothetical protein